MLRLPDGSSSKIVLPPPGGTCPGRHVEYSLAFASTREFEIVVNLLMIIDARRNISSASSVLEQAPRESAKHYRNAG